MQYKIKQKHNETAKAQCSLATETKADHKVTMSLWLTTANEKWRSHDIA